MTWRDLMTAVEGLQHRLVRLAGDEAALSYVLTEQADSALRECARVTNVPIPNARELAKLVIDLAAAVHRSGREADRIARELAQAVEVIERVKPDEADDTGVLGIADVGRETCDDE